MTEGRPFAIMFTKVHLSKAGLVVREEPDVERKQWREVMRQTSLLLALSLCSFVTASSEEPAYFEDWNLGTVVEDTLWITRPTPSDMLGMLYLDATAQGIQKLTGLEHATNLLTLRLGDNQYIADVSPLAGLTNLTLLVVSQNRISDISPLSELTRLRELDIHHNRISDISALAGLTRLQRLALRENPLRDISVLSGLTMLDDLILSFTEVSDISPLLGLTSLRRLDLRDCPLDQSACAIYIPQIAANNPGIDILYNPVVTISSSTGGSVAHPGEGTFTLEAGATILLWAEADPGCAFFHWSGSLDGTQNPLTLTITSSQDIQANFYDLSRTFFVDAAGPYDVRPGDPTAGDPHEDGTQEHPFDMIQEAIDAATDGTSIFVRPGTYRENIDFLGKSLRVIGFNPDRPNGPPYPVIDGAGSGPVVCFTSDEGPDCTLAGFVITRGKGQLASAVHCHGSSPTIANCLIVGNRSDRSAGVTVYCRSSHATLANCTIADNRADWQGAGIHLVDSEIVLTNSIVWGNWPRQILVTGTGTPVITYTDFQGGWSGTGVIDADPLFVRAGYWLDPDDPEMTPEPSDPCTVWMEGDYHLRSQAGRRHLDTPGWQFDNMTSPCIDAGNPDSPVAHEPPANGGRINIGAYGGTAEASKSPSGLPGKYGGGSGEVTDPYLVFTAEQLNAIGAEPGDWDRHFRLMADIDLSAYAREQALIIGTGPDSPFSGVFDGGGYAISGFVCGNPLYYDSVGLFGYVGGMVTNVGLIDPNVGGGFGYYIGALVGDNHGLVSNCFVEDANVVGENWYAGGLMGRNEGTMTDCRSAGAVGGRIAGGLVGLNRGSIEGCSSVAVVAGDDRIGGLVGDNSGGTVTNCWSAGTVTGDDKTGGLVGGNSNGTIAGCYSTATVFGNDGVGGLVGENLGGTIADCYAAANVTGDRLTAGLVGDNGAGTIRNCYATGNTVGRWPVGGLVTFRHDDDIVTASFWDIEATGCSWSAAGTGRTTAEMQTPSTFLAAGWDFAGETENGTEDLWRILDGQDYPRLSWELVPEN